MYRVHQNEVEVLLGHPGGPFFARKDRGSWTIPKGLTEGSESSFEAACREFREETGLEPEVLPPSEADFVTLGEITLRGGKKVEAWAFEGDCEPESLAGNTFEMEWPPRSGRRQSFPEIDRFAYFELAEAADFLSSAQRPFLERLAEVLLTRAASTTRTRR